MHRAKNLLPEVVDFANLYQAFQAAGSGKRDRREVQIFEHDLETKLWEIHREVSAGSYRWGEFRRFLISDPKRRQTKAAPFRDRVLHHALFNVINPILRRGFIADTYACIGGRGTHRAVNRFHSFVHARNGSGYALHGDIHSYFASVDHEILMALLRRRIGDGALLRLLGSLVAHGAEAPGKGMPIGNLTSQLFANLYLDPLDHFVKEGLRIRYYLRYMDDFILVVGDRLEGRFALRRIAGFLDAALALGLNRRRVVLAPLSAPQDVLGYVHFADGHRRVRRRSVRRLWRRLPRLDARLASGELTWEFVRASIGSWFGLARHADAYRLSTAIFTQRDVRNLGKRLLVADGATVAWRT